MRFTIDIYPSKPDQPQTIEFRLVDLAGVDMVKIDTHELRRRLEAPGVGLKLMPSVSAIRGIVGTLVRRGDLQDDVKHTLVLLDQCCQAAAAADIAEAAPVVESEYRRKVLAAQRIMAGDVPVGKRGVSVPDGVIQTAIASLLEASHADYEAATGKDRQRVVERVVDGIFFFSGSRPSKSTTEETLRVIGRKGRPPGPRLPAGVTRTSKNETINKLLAEVGLGSTPQGVGTRSKRHRKKAGLSKPRRPNPSRGGARQGKESGRKPKTGK